jgi:NAD(P)H-flavin reductase
VYIYISAGLCLITYFLEFILVLYRNITLKSGISCAEISNIDDFVQIRLNLSRSLKVSAGQYIGLWIPGISFWSFLQNHPFTVVSWTEGKSSSLDLLIEPRSGFTQKLLQYSRNNQRNSVQCVALYTGPHGVSESVEDYETVLLVASGMGIVAQLPYLKQLLHGYKTCKSRTRRVHLVWQSQAFSKLPSSQRCAKTISHYQKTVVLKRFSHLLTKLSITIKITMAVLVKPPITGSLLTFRRSLIYQSS